MEILLSEAESALKAKIDNFIEEFYRLIKSTDSDEKFKRINEIIEQAGVAGHELHQSLAQKGKEPRHHKYMIENRGFEPSHNDFYKHIHPLEDLLKFIKDDSINQPILDITIGEKFEFKVYSRRWAHDDIYSLTRTATGWKFSHINIHLGGECDKSCHPYLYENLRHDSIEYPSGLSYWIEHVWEKAQDEGLNKEQVQNALNELAEWVSKTEKSAPSSEIWEGM